MLGIVIVTHGKLGEILVETSEIILNSKPEAVVSVSINLAENVEKLRQKIETAIKSVNTNNGILILTDMFGGTPSNLSYSFLEEGRIEVISGVNLPVLIKAINLRKKTLEIHEMAKTIEDYGKKSISLASDILKGNKRA
jgi:PTS system mannose-specific IIA component